MVSNPLTELIPATYRKYVYLVAAAALFVYGLWEVAAGDIRTFVVSLVSALVSGLAASNTHASNTHAPETPAPVDPEIEGDEEEFEDAEVGMPQDEA